MLQKTLYVSLYPLQQWRADGGYPPIQVVCYLNCEGGARSKGPQCAAIMDILGDNLLHCDRDTQRIRRHEAQVRLLEADLIKSARHPVLEPRPFGRHKELPNISPLDSHGGSDTFDIIICHPSSPA